MANVFTKQRFILDTAGATLLAASLAPDLLRSLPLKIKHIRWVGATTAGHAATIVDSTGLVLWESLASGANYVEADRIEAPWFTDFALTALQSGRLIITLAWEGKW